MTSRFSSLVAAALVVLVVMAVGCAQEAAVETTPLTPADSESATGRPPTPEDGQPINVVEQAALRDTVAVKVMEFSDAAISGEEGPYALRLAITDPGLIGQIVDALDTDLDVAPKLKCIAEYKLRFELADGTVQAFWYSCGDAFFLNGNQDFMRGQDFFPPEELNELVKELLAATIVDRQR